MNTHRLMPVALLPAIKDAIVETGGCFKPESLWTAIIAAFDQVQQAAPIQSGDVRNQAVIAEAIDLLRGAAEPSATQDKADIGMCAQWDVDALIVAGKLRALASTPSAAMEGQGDYAELRKLAEDATPGPWMHLFGERTVYDRMEDGCRGNCIVQTDYPASRTDAQNLDFIAAANPEVILALLNQLDFTRAAYDGAHDDRMALAAQIAAQPQAGSRELTDAARDVLAERLRQVSAEGWTPAHDAEYQKDELQRAAMCYLMRPACDSDLPHALWPWKFTWWKPTTERRNLVKAAALTIAEIERLDRLTGQAGEGGK